MILITSPEVISLEFRYDSFAENLGTFAAAWVYPSQQDGWHIVPIDKMGAWYLLMLLSFVLVSLVHRPERVDRDATTQAPVASATIASEERRA